MLKVLGKDESAEGRKNKTKAGAKGKPVQQRSNLQTFRTFSAEKCREIDRNNLLNMDFDKELHSRGMEHKGTILRKLDLYCNHNRIAFLHRPFCIASDSRGGKFQITTRACTACSLYCLDTTPSDFRASGPFGSPRVPAYLPLL